MHAYCTERLTRCEGREGADGNRDRIEVENGDGNGDGNGDWVGTEVEEREWTQDTNGDGGGVETVVETKGRTQDRNGDGERGRNRGK